MNVRVGSHIAPAGGPEIVERLSDLLVAIIEHHIDPWIAHCTYEDLHPFMDGNGRSGRALWAWMMLRQNGGSPLGFLHHFYYQTLEHSAARAAKHTEQPGEGITEGAIEACAARLFGMEWDTKTNRTIARRALEVAEPYRKIGVVLSAAPASPQPQGG